MICSILNIYCASTLSYSWQIVAGAIFGIIFGLLLVKNNFCDREKVRSMLRLAEGKMVAAIAAMLFFGLILRFAACRWNILPENPGVSGGELVNSIFGGILCGVGIYICGFAPLSAVAGLGCGKTPAFWTIFGMILAILTLQWWRDHNFFNLRVWNKTLPVGKVTWDFFDSGNPALYAVAVLGIVLLIIAMRRNAD